MIKRMMTMSILAMTTVLALQPVCASSDQASSVSNEPTFNQGRHSLEIVRQSPEDELEPYLAAVQQQWSVDWVRYPDNDLHRLLTQVLKRGEIRVEDQNPEEVAQAFYRAVQKLPKQALRVEDLKQKMRPRFAKTIALLELIQDVSDKDIAARKIASLICHDGLSNNDIAAIKAAIDKAAQDSQGDSPAEVKVAGILSHNAVEAIPEELKNQGVLEWTVDDLKNHLQQYCYGRVIDQIVGTCNALAEERNLNKICQLIKEISYFYLTQPPSDLLSHFFRAVLLACAKSDIKNCVIEKRERNGKGGFSIKGSQEVPEAVVQSLDEYTSTAQQRFVDFVMSHKLASNESLKKVMSFPQSLTDGSEIQSNELNEILSDIMALSKKEVVDIEAVDDNFSEIRMGINDDKVSQDEGFNEQENIQTNDAENLDYEGQNQDESDEIVYSDQYFFVLDKEGKQTIAVDPTNIYFQYTEGKDRGWHKVACQSAIFGKGGVRTDRTFSIDPKGETVVDLAKCFTNDNHTEQIESLSTWLEQQGVFNPAVVWPDNGNDAALLNTLEFRDDDDKQEWQRVEYVEDIYDSRDHIHEGRTFKVVFMNCENDKTKSGAIDLVQGFYVKSNGSNSWKRLDFYRRIEQIFPHKFQPSSWAFFDDEGNKYNQDNVRYRYLGTKSWNQIEIPSVVFDTDGNVREGIELGIKTGRRCKVIDKQCVFYINVGRQGQIKNFENFLAKAFDFASVYKKEGEGYRQIDLRNLQVEWKNGYSGRVVVLGDLYAVDQNSNDVVVGDQVASVVDASTGVKLELNDPIYVKNAQGKYVIVKGLYDRLAAIYPWSESEQQDDDESDDVQVINLDTNLEEDENQFTSETLPISIFYYNGNEVDITKLYWKNGRSKALSITGDNIRKVFNFDCNREDVTLSENVVLEYKNGRDQFVEIDINKMFADSNNEQTVTLGDVAKGLCQHFKLNYDSMFMMEEEEVSGSISSNYRDVEDKDVDIVYIKNAQNKLVSINLKQNLYYKNGKKYVQITEDNYEALYDNSSIGQWVQFYCKDEKGEFYKIIAENLIDADGQKIKNFAGMVLKVFEGQQE